MPTSPSKLLPISVNLPGANAVMGGIPLGSSVSPSSFATYDEPLTVRPCSVMFGLLGNLYLRESKPSITPVMANPSLLARPSVITSVGAHIIPLTLV